MIADEPISSQPWTIVQTINTMVQLMKEFDHAVNERDSNAAERVLEEICLSVQETQMIKESERHRDFFINQAIMLQSYNIEALSHLNCHRNSPPNWGAVITYKQVIDGFVDRMHTKVFAASAPTAEQ
jgi:hypothetical protein